MDSNLTKDPYARRYLREVKTTTTKFIANSGCILGFCMGFSLISGAEVVLDGANANRAAKNGRAEVF